MTHSIGPKPVPCEKLSHETCPDKRALGDELADRLDDATGKWECIAHDLGVDVSLLSHWTSGRGQMPAYRLIRFTEVMGPGLLRWIAKRCGFNLVRVNECLDSCANEKASPSRLAS